MKDKKKALELSALLVLIYLAVTIYRNFSPSLNPPTSAPTSQPDLNKWINQ